MWTFPIKNLKPTERNIELRYACMVLVWLAYGEPSFPPSVRENRAVRASNRFVHTRSNAIPKRRYTPTHSRPRESHAWQRATNSRIWEHVRRREAEPSSTSTSSSLIVNRRIRKKNMTCWLFKILPLCQCVTIGKEIDLIYQHSNKNVL